MRYLWAAPAGVAVVGTVLLIGALARLAEQAKGLRRDLRRFSELRPALVALRHASDEARQAAEALRHR
jgi:cytochrome c-type biogenesis protein CcmH/NrfF